MRTQLDAHQIRTFDAAAMMKGVEEALKGRFSPAHLVVLAQKEDHPLHRFFDWDDAKAAERWRALVCEKPRKQKNQKGRKARCQPQR